MGALGSALSREGARGLKRTSTLPVGAAKQQVWGAPEDGVEPLDWSGSDIDKIEALIHSFVSTMHNLAPLLKGYHYDFQSAQFTDGQGRPVTGAALSANIPRAARIGEKTARRVVLLQTLLSADSSPVGGRRGAILEQLLRWGDTSSPRSLDTLFSRRANDDELHGNRAKNTGTQPAVKSAWRDERGRIQAAPLVKIKDSGKTALLNCLHSAAKVRMVFGRVTLKICLAILNPCLPRFLQQVMRQSIRGASRLFVPVVSRL